MRLDRYRNSAPTRIGGGGFTLLELVIAVAILGIMLGAAIPAASMIFRSKATRATREALEELASASAEYFHDTFQLPDDVVDLNVDPGVRGWMGPYMLTATSDPIMGITDEANDAWRRPFLFDVQSNSVLRIVSSGEDGAFGTEADIEITLDVTALRRARTLEELRTINQAITLYNGTNLPDDPLPTSYVQILTELILAGLLPSGGGYDDDGWGDAYIVSPAGQAPVVRVGSSNLPGTQ